MGDLVEGGNEIPLIIVKRNGDKRKGKIIRIMTALEQKLK